jgi:hypothetical protein
MLHGDIIKLMTENMTTEHDIRGTDATGLTVEYAWNVGKAMADWLPTAGHVVVMYAPEGQKIANAVIEGLRLQGRSVMDGGIGDRTMAATHIQTGGLSGGVVVGTDSQSNMTTIELLQETGHRIEGEVFFAEITELIEGGNFVPAAVKGELTAIA